MKIILRHWRRAPRDYFALCPVEVHPENPAHCRLFEWRDKEYRGGVLEPTGKLARLWVNYEIAIHDSTPAKVMECQALANGIVTAVPYTYLSFVKHKPMHNRRYKKGTTCPTSS